MSEQQKLYDDLKNIVTHLNRVIPALQKLTDTTAESVNEKVSESVSRVDSKLKELMLATVSLEETTSENISYIRTVKEQAVEELIKGVKTLINTDVSSEYQEQIAEVIERLEPLIYQAINEEIKRLGNIQQVSIKSKNEQLTELKETVKTDINEVIGELSTAIDSIDKLSKKIKTNADVELSKLNEVSTAHKDVLKDVNKDTYDTAQSMKKTLNTIDKHAMFLAQSPVSMTSIFVTIMSTSFLGALIYKFDLWFNFIYSLGIILLIIGVFWGVMYGIEKIQEKQNE